MHKGRCKSDAIMQLRWCVLVAGTMVLYTCTHTNACLHRKMKVSGKSYTASAYACQYTNNRSFTPSRTLARQHSGSFIPVRLQHQLAGLSLDFTLYRDVQQDLPLDDLNLLFCLKVKVGLVTNVCLRSCSLRASQMGVSRLYVTS